MCGGDISDTVAFAVPVARRSLTARLPSCAKVTAFRAVSARRTVVLVGVSVAYQSFLARAAPRDAHACSGDRPHRDRWPRVGGILRFPVQPAGPISRAEGHAGG